MGKEELSPTAPAGRGDPSLFLSLASPSSLVVSLFHVVLDLKISLCSSFNHYFTLFLHLPHTSSLLCVALSLFTTLSFSLSLPVPLWLDFPSLVIFFISLSLALPPSFPPPSLCQCHCIHMAPACDRALSQNTPDAMPAVASASLPLCLPFSRFNQASLNFKQNKTRKEGKVREEESASHQKHVVPGNVQKHYNHIHSFTPLLLSCPLVTRVRKVSLRHLE